MDAKSTSNLKRMNCGAHHNTILIDDRLHWSVAIHVGEPLTNGKRPPQLGTKVQGPRCVCVAQVENSVCGNDFETMSPVDKRKKKKKRERFTWTVRISEVLSAAAYKLARPPRPPPPFRLEQCSENRCCCCCCCLWPGPLPSSRSTSSKSTIRCVWHH